MILKFIYASMYSVLPTYFFFLLVMIKKNNLFHFQIITVIDAFIYAQQHTSLSIFMLIKFMIFLWTNNNFIFISVFISDGQLERLIFRYETNLKVFYFIIII